MNRIKKLLGIVWILGAFLAAYFCIVKFGYPKLISYNQSDLVFGIIIVFVLTPLIVIGLGVFGYFALRGAYNDNKIENPKF